MARCDRWLVGLLLFGSFTAVHAEQTPVVRRYVVLPQAVQVKADRDTFESRTLTIEWLPPAQPGGRAKIESVSLDGLDSLSTKYCRLTEDGDRVTGEVTLPASRRWADGSWRFSAGPLEARESTGSFEGKQAGEQRAGSARFLTAYDVGGTLGIRAWVPPGTDPVRGILIWGNAGSGDSRHEVLRDSWQAFCRLHRFAMVGTCGYGLAMTRLLLEQMAVVARHTGHPELNEAPVIYTGHSNGGIKAWEFNALFPQRTIAFTVSKAAGAGMPGVSAAGLATPAMLVAGDSNDAMFNAEIRRLFVSNRTRATPWSFIVEANIGHDRGRAPQLWLPFFHWAVQARLPEESPGARPAPLRPIDLEKGWIVAHGPLPRRDKRFGPAPEMTDLPVADSSWFPNEVFIYGYFGLTTPDPFQLELEANRGAFFPNEPIRVTVGDFTRRSWREVRVLINGRLAGRVTPEAPTLTIASGPPGVYVATVLGFPADSSPMRVGGPVSWVVEPR